MKMAILMATRLLDQVLNEKVFQPLKMQEQREAKSPTPTLWNLSMTGFVIITMYKYRQPFCMQWCHYQYQHLQQLHDIVNGQPLDW